MWYNRYMNSCSVQDCWEKISCRGYCKSHYNQWYGNRPVGKVASREYHGLVDIPEYDIWIKMKTRCNNPSDKDFPEWGGRGIKVYDEWQTSFKAFLNYMGRRPSSKHSIDRIDNDGNYEPGNVRWATVKEQANNKRLYKANKTGCSGIYKIRDDRFRVYARDNGVQKHIGYFNTLEKSIKALELHNKVL